MVGVAAVHGEAQAAQVDSAVQNGRHTPAVLVGHADNFCANVAVGNGEPDTGAEERGSGAEGWGAWRSVAGGPHRL